MPKYTRKKRGIKSRRKKRGIKSRRKNRGIKSRRKKRGIKSRRKNVMHGGMVFDLNFMSDIVRDNLSKVKNRVNFELDKANKKATELKSNVTNRFNKVSNCLQGTPTSMTQMTIVGGKKHKKRRE